MDKAPLNPSAAITVNRPTWRVDLTGVSQTGHSRQQTVQITVWSGLAGKPAHEAVFEAALNMVLDRLIQAGLTAANYSFQRLSPQNPADLEAKFQTAVLTLREAPS